MIFFTPPTPDECQRNAPFDLAGILAQREAYCERGQPLYALPGSDLTHGILSRSPLALHLLVHSTGSRRSFRMCSHTYVSAPALIHCLLHRMILSVSFRALRMDILFATPEGPHPITLTFRPQAIATLRRECQKLKGNPSDFCFGAGHPSGEFDTFLSDFPCWKLSDLILSPLPPAPYIAFPFPHLLNLILCCEIGHCPARLFQLLDLTADETLETLTNLPPAQAANLRAQLESVLPAPFTPPPAPAPKEIRPINTYAELSHFLKQHNLSAKDLALALQTDYASFQHQLFTDPKRATAPLPQPIQEIIAYTQTHSRTDVRQELRRRAGPDYANCTLWSALELRDFRTRYQIPQKRLKELLPSEVLYLSRWENCEADIPLTVCKALDELRHAFRLVFPEVENAFGNKIAEYPRHRA